MEWPLSGLRVADLSAGIAGGYCTKVLADGGAEVIKLEPPEGDRLRGWSAGTPDATMPVGKDGALFQFLACSKSSVVIDPAARRAQRGHPVRAARPDRRGDRPAGARRHHRNEACKHRFVPGLPVTDPREKSGSA
jgi:hypothetical protein